MSKELFSSKEQLTNELHTLHEKLDKLQLTVDELNAKLTKHIGLSFLFCPKQKLRKRKILNKKN